MNLFDEVKRSKTDAEVVALIKQWFEWLPRIENKSRFEVRADMYATVAKGGGSFLKDVILEAKDDPAMREGLRRYALSQSLDGETLQPELAALLLSEPPKPKRGRQPDSGSTYTEAISMRYARAVWCVYHGGAGRYTLSTNDTHPENNAFSLVAKATGATFDEVRNATRDGQLERLTKIAELYESQG